VTEIERTLHAIVLVSGWLLLALFLVAAAVDQVLAILEAPSIGYRVQRWARQYPAFAVALIFVFGALLGHFFTQ
jgi:uncharacterized metal-binding protein